VVPIAATLLASSQYLVWNILPVYALFDKFDGLLIFFSSPLVPLLWNMASTGLWLLRHWQQYQGEIVSMGDKRTKGNREGEV
jgi:hypothetical protein